MAKRKERIDRGIKVRSDEIYCLTSVRDMLYVAAPRVVPIAGILILPLVISAYGQKVLLSLAVYGLLALGWDFFYKAGLISMGQALFFGVGAFLSGSLNHYFHWSPWLAVPTATIVGSAFCTLILAPVLRLRGIYFAMVTLVLPLMLTRLIEATRILGGTEGITGIDSFPNPLIEAYLLLGAAAAALFGFRRIMATDYGLVLRAMHDNDRSVIRAGHSLNWLKAQALFLGGLAGTCAGAFMTHAYMFVGMPSFALDYSILPIAAAVVGGTGTLAGPAVGALVLVPLSEVLRALGALRIVAYGVFLVVFAVAVPEGLFSFLQRKYHQFERWTEVES